MTYSHRTNNSFTPSLDFWRLIEILLETFPYKQGKKGGLISDEFLTYYERKYSERFDVNYNDFDIYGKSLSREYINIPLQRSYLDEMDDNQRARIDPTKIQRDRNSTGRVVKFLSNSISNANKVYRFQHFFESAYYYLIDILNLNPDLPFTRQHGLDNRDNAQFQTRWERFKNESGGLLQASDFVNEFNKICRAHNVPFIMFVLDEHCYVIYTTDIFVEKIIQEIPLFLTDPNLKGANLKFVQAYVKRNEGNHKESLATMREGLEAVRDYVYNRYNLTKSTSVHNDFEKLFTTHANIIFDFSKIPEDDPGKLEKIVKQLKNTILLTVKKGNFGHHTITRTDLLEENTSIFALGLVASVIPYLLYLLR